MQNRIMEHAKLTEQKPKIQLKLLTVQNMNQF